MKRFLTLPVLPLAVASLLLAQQAPQKPIEEDDTRVEGQAAIRVDVEQVRVDVTVQDDDGNLITGLSPNHFEVYEDKVKQEITHFEAVEAPMTAVLVTEYSRRLPWNWLYEVLLASYTFVERMRPDDYIAVVAYDMRPEILVDFTANKAEVYQALRRLNFPAFRESNLYDTVYDTLDRLEEVEGKVAMILLTTGLDTFSKKNLNATLDKAKQSSVVIYPVSLGGHDRARYEHRLSGPARLDFYQADSTLKHLAKYTGGQAFFPRFESQYPGIFNVISALLRNQYALGYVSTNTDKDDDYRKIEVKVKADVDGNGKPDKLKVSHREGYLPRDNS